MKFQHNESLTFEDIKKQVKEYLPVEVIPLIEKSYHFSQLKHENQKRVSGEQYIIHPMHVAYYASLIKMDAETIMACFLHDVIEDCNVSFLELENEFTLNVANIVEACSKVSKLVIKDIKSESFKKLFLAMSKDFRVVVVKILDRLHNMKTLKFLRPEKRIVIAKETLEVYAPLALRLGLRNVKNELEDLSFYYTNTPAYYRLSEKIGLKKQERENYIQIVLHDLKEHLVTYNIEAEIQGRSKNLLSIYKKMQRKEVDFEQIQDLLAFRIVVNNITACYKVLGVLHSEYIPVPGRFKDYIAIPKVNNYQSLHTQVIGPLGSKIEIQIRTVEMQEVAERGIAAHWYYKDNGSVVVKKNWFSDLIDEDKKDNFSVLTKIREDFYQKSIFVFTPNGDLKELPVGSTLLDFAYSIHSEIGNTCEGGKINGKMYGIRHKLMTGDVVSILTNKNQRPSNDWLKIAKTTRALSKIQNWILKEDKIFQEKSGEKILEKVLKLENVSLKTFIKSTEFLQALNKFSYKNPMELYFALGSGKLLVSHFLSFFPNFNIKTNVKEETSKEIIVDLDLRSAVLVNNLKHIDVKISKCCLPLPGDEIISFITKFSGISVHRVTCPKNQELEEKKKIDAQWNMASKNFYESNIKIVTKDRPGTISSVAKCLEKLKINIIKMNMQSVSVDAGVCALTLQVKDLVQLEQIISQLSLLPVVITVERV